MIYLYDKERHLICHPYSIQNLHIMARKIGIKKCWFHSGKYPHYDIPLYKLDEVKRLGVEASKRDILNVIKNSL